MFLNLQKLSDLLFQHVLLLLNIPQSPVCLPDLLAALLNPSLQLLHF